MNTARANTATKENIVAKRFLGTKREAAAAATATTTGAKIAPEAA
jgi:hypothetical protein